MSYINDSLTDNEQVEAVFKLHWVEWISFWCSIILAPLTLGITLLFAVWKFLQNRSIEMGATNRRVVLKTGFISRNTDEMKLSSIETVEIKQSVLGRMLGYGSVYVSGRGISDVVLDSLVAPLEVKRKIDAITMAAGN